MSNHYGFFTSFGNAPMHNQFVHLSSSTSYGGDSHHIKGMGTYIHSSNLRYCIALFSASGLSKHTWINDQDRYRGREDKTNE
jgi:hypothetical protein